MEDPPPSTSSKVEEINNFLHTTEGDYLSLWEVTPKAAQQIRGLISEADLEAADARYTTLYSYLDSNPANRQGKLLISTNEQNQNHLRRRILPHPHHQIQRPDQHCRNMAPARRSALANTVHPPTSLLQRHHILQPGRVSRVFSST